jgi:hypothetical protein
LTTIKTTSITSSQFLLKIFIFKSGTFTWASVLLCPTITSHLRMIHTSARGVGTRGSWQGGKGVGTCVGRMDDAARWIDKVKHRR